MADCDASISLGFELPREASIQVGQSDLSLAADCV